MDQQSIQQCRFDAAGLPTGYDFQADWEWTLRQVKMMLKGDGDLVLMDCRTEQEHRMARILMPLQKIVTHCSHGGRSLQAAYHPSKTGLHGRSLDGWWDQPMVYRHRSRRTEILSDPNSR